MRGRCRVQGCNLFVLYALWERESRHVTVTLWSFFGDVGLNMKTHGKQTPRLRVIEAVQLDVTNQCLWRGGRRILLRPKDFAVLHSLQERAGQLVSKTTLLDTLWPGVVVTEAVLKACINRLRHALGDDAQAPRYIETVHRRGYRLLQPLPTTPQPVASSQYSVVSSPPSPAQHSVLVGREQELAQLHAWLDKALRGERQVVFVTGEAGIGKTALVDAFFAGIRRQGTGSGQQANRKTDARSLRPDPWISWGQCIEHFGVGEAYLPVLAALQHLGQGPGRERVVHVLRRHASTWLMQLPGLVSEDDRASLPRRTAGATRERMLRELADAMEELTVEQGVVLWLEDLHWSDVSTLEWVSYVARRTQPARLLIVGTLRPIEILANTHPLRAVTQELRLHHHCEELRLSFLTEAHIAEYLARRFGRAADHDSPFRELAAVIHRRTEGNPLFMINVVEQLVFQGMLGKKDEKKDEQAGTTGPEMLLPPLAADQLGVPQDIQHLIERQLDHVSAEEQHILEAASVTGLEFSAAAVAAALAADIQEVEQHCATLARHERFLQVDGTEEWADGSIASRYRFIHALYQEVIYDRLTAARRVHLHLQVGLRKEQGYGARVGDIAAELALHFEHGRDYPRAVQYLRDTAQTALRRRAPREAIAHLTHALELLATLPNSPERAQTELALRIALGVPLLMTKGYADPEVERTYTRARELCQQLGARPQLFPALHGLWVFHEVRADLRIARALGDEMFALAQSEQSPALLLQAHHVLGETSYLQGELTAAREHLERASALYDPRQHEALGLLYGLDPGVVSLSYTAWTVGLLGYAEQQRKKVQEALTLARQTAFPLSSGVALIAAAIVSQAQREAQAAREQAETAIALANEQGLPLLLARAAIVRGWALTIQGRGEDGIAQIQQGLSASRAMGAIAGLPYFLSLLAEAYEATGQMAEGLHVLDEALALVSKNNDCNYEAELYRLKGELTLQQAAGNSDRRPLLNA